MVKGCFIRGTAPQQSLYLFARKMQLLISEKSEQDLNRPGMKEKDRALKWLEKKANGNFCIINR